MLALLSLLACSSLASRGEALSGSQAFAWDFLNDFTIVGEPKMGGSADAYDGQLHFEVHGFPPGTVLRYGEVSAQVDDEGRGGIEAPVASAFGAIPLTRDWIGLKLPGLTLQVEPPGQPAIDVALPPLSVDYSRFDFARQVKAGPVLYEGETAGSEPIRTILLDGVAESRVFGSAQTLGDIDAVAFVRHTQLEEKICGGYVNEKGAPAPDVTLLVSQARVEVIDRRSGQVAADHTFAPNEAKCPEAVTTYTGGAIGLDDEGVRRPSPDPTAAIHGWIEAQLVNPAAGTP